MSDLYEEIGANLRKIRNEQGVRQSELAKKLNVSPSQYYKYEEGQSKPSIPKLIKAASLLGVELETLLPEGVLGERNFVPPQMVAANSDEISQEPDYGVKVEQRPLTQAVASVEAQVENRVETNPSALSDTELLSELISAFLALSSRTAREKLVRFLQAL